MRVSFLPFVFLASQLIGCAGDSPELQQRAAAVFEKAKAAVRRGDHLQSRSLLNEVQALDKRSRSGARRAEASLLLAENYAAGGEFALAAPLYQQAHQLYTDLGDKPSALAATLAYARMLHHQQREDEAYRILTNALKLAEALDEHESVRQLRWALVPVARSMEDVELEGKLLTMLEQESIVEKDVASQAKVRFEQGQSQLRRRKYSEALERFRAAAAVAQSGITKIDALQFCAVAYDKLGNVNEAFRTFADALRRTDDAEGAESLREEMLLRVGNIYLRQRRHDDAKKFLNTALRSAIRTQNTMHEAYALLQLGHATSGRNGADATKTLSAGLELAKSIGVPSLNAYACASLGIEKLRAGELSDALKLLREAAGSFDSAIASRDENAVAVDCEQTLFGVDAAYAYIELINLLCTLGKTDEAFLYANRKDGRSLQNIYDALNVRTKNPKHNSQLENYRRSIGDYVGAERALMTAASLHSESRSLLANVHESFAQARTEVVALTDSIAFLNPQLPPALFADSMSITATQNLVPNGAAVVRYVPTQKTLYTFISTRNKTAVEISSIERAQLHNLSHHYIALLRAPEQNAATITTQAAHLRDLSSKLYQIFIRPLERNVPPSTQLLIVFPTDMPIIPLHALQKVGARSPFAIEQYAFHYLPCIEALKLKPTRTRATRAIVLFGNQGNTVWDVEYELRELTSFARESRVYFNRDASQQTLQQETGDVLHCALDVRFNPRSPANSLLVLSDGVGYKTSTYPRWGELFTVAPFSTVIISNLSEQQMHASLPLIFKINGTADVITTNYLPSRKAKKFFNEVFYSFLLSGSTIDVAYRNALLQLLKNQELASPKEWAAFFLW